MNIKGFKYNCYFVFLVFIGYNNYIGFLKEKERTFRWEVLAVGKSIFSLLKIINFLRDKRVGFSKKLLFFIPIIYLLLPFDLIGDFFPLAGQLDDVAVFILMWPVLKSLLSKYDKQYSGSSGENGNKKEQDAIDIDGKDYKIE